MLRRLLTRRFGTLPDGVEQLHATTVQGLERWADRARHVPPCWAGR